MEITLKVDKVFNEMCERAGTRPEVVLKCFMWDVMIAGEGQRPNAGSGVMGYYHATLKESPQGQAYLTERGLMHPELIDRFKLGHANSTLAYQLPKKYTVAGKAVREQLQRVGVTRATGFEHLGGCIVVPIIGEDEDDRGRVWQLYGRRTADAKLGRNDVRHLYLGAPLRGVWNASALMAHKEIIVCEALIDAMTFWWACATGPCWRRCTARESGAWRSSGCSSATSITSAAR